MRERESSIEIVLHNGVNLYKPAIQRDKMAQSGTTQGKKSRQGQQGNVTSRIFKNG